MPTVTLLERTHLRHYRVEGFARVFARIVHHQVDKNRHQESENGRTVADFRPVYAAVPGRAAVDQLIAQDVYPVWPRGTSIVRSRSSRFVSPSRTASQHSAYPSLKPWDESVWGEGTLDRQALCATCVMAPSARRIFRADFGASSGPDMCPASNCGLTVAAGPYGVRRSGPDLSRVLEGTLLHTGSPDPVSRLLRQPAPCPLPLRRPRDLQRAYAAAAGDW